MAMVEMVIVLPVLLVLLFATIEFGIVLMRWQTLSNAAREGARTAVLFRTPCNAGTVQSEAETQVVTYASNANIPITAADVNVVGQCAGPGTDTTVTVTHTYTFQVLGGLLTGFGPSITLTGNSVMRNEG
jgi:Flp pilus assembly protein TadG